MDITQRLSTLVFWVMLIDFALLVIAIMVGMIYQLRKEAKQGVINFHSKKSEYEEKRAKLNRLHEREQELYADVKVLIKSGTPSSWDEKIEEAKAIDQERREIFPDPAYEPRCSNLEFVLAISGRGPIAPLLRQRRFRGGK